MTLFSRIAATLATSGIVLILGGKDAAGTSTTEVQLLDPSSGVLTPTVALGTARVGHTATLPLAGRVLVTGGADGNALEQLSFINEKGGIVISVLSLQR